MPNQNLPKHKIKTTLRIDPYLKSLADAMVVKDNTNFQQIVNTALEIYLVVKKPSKKNKSWVDDLPSIKGFNIKKEDLSRESLYKK